MIIGRGTLTIAVIVALALIAAACTSSPVRAEHQSTTTTTSATTTTTNPSHKPSVAVDLSATPRGWVPVAFSGVQISVPATWNIGYHTSCDSPRAPGTVFVGLGNGECSSTSVRVPTVQLFPAVLGKGASVTSERVNGIVVEIAFKQGNLSEYLIPTFSVGLDLSGAAAQRVLGTLTYSPRAVVLAGSPFPSVPSLWRWTSFAGIRFAAPATWERKSTPYYGPGCGPPGIYMESGITLSTDERLIVPACPIVGLLPVSVPVGGVRVDAIASRVTPTPTGLSTHCMQIHSLTACPYSIPAFNVLYLSVSGPRLRRPVMVEVGLAGDGSVGRTIVGSLRAA